MGGFVFGEDEAEDRDHCAANGIHYCEPGNPWPGNPSVGVLRAYHPEAAEVGEQESGWPGGDWVRSRCPVCGHAWSHELPQ